MQRDTIDNQQARPASARAQLAIVRGTMVAATTARAPAPAGGFWVRLRRAFGGEG